MMSLCENEVEAILFLTNTDMKEKSCPLSGLWVLEFVIRNKRAVKPLSYKILKQILADRNGSLQL